MNSKRWYILGAGAIGSLWAGYWRADQTPVTIISRREEAQRELTLISGEQRYHYTLPCLNVRQIKEPIEQLLITTKAYQTVEAFADVKNLLSDNARLIVLQNGMEATNLYLPPTLTLYAATTTDGAYFNDANLNDTNLNSGEELIHAGCGQTLIGLLSGNTTEPQALLKQLPRGLDIRYREDILNCLWRKLAINCAVNPLTVKYRCRNGELLERQEAMNDLTALCGEITSVANALGVSAWSGDLLDEVKNVLRITAGNRNSMLEDVVNGRSTEINQLNGYLLKRAEELGLQCPANLRMVEGVVGF